MVPKTLSCSKRSSAGSSRCLHEGPLPFGRASRGPRGALRVRRGSLGGCNENGGAPGRDGPRAPELLTAFRALLDGDGPGARAEDAVRRALVETLLHPDRLEPRRRARRVASGLRPRPQVTTAARSSQQDDARQRPAPPSALHRISPRVHLRDPARGHQPRRLDASLDRARRHGDPLDRATGAIVESLGAPS